MPFCQIRLISTVNVVLKEYSNGKFSSLRFSLEIQPSESTTKRREKNILGNQPKPGLLQSLGPLEPGSLGRGSQNLVFSNFGIPEPGILEFQISQGSKLRLWLRL